MTELSHYIQLHDAYDCGLVIDRNLRHLRYGLSVYEDEIALERIFRPKSLMSFANYADRLVATFERASAYQICMLGNLREFQFAEFTSELSATISTHHQRITQALCPLNRSVPTARSKWLADGRSNEDYRELLHASRRLALDADEELFSHQCYLRDTVLDSAADALDSLGNQFQLQPVQRSYRFSPVSHPNVEAEPNDG